MKLSLTVITKNEEACIRRCIESVPLASEVIVVDSGSTDRTVEICRELGARVTVTPDYPGNGPQKNRALDLATGDWILSLDADEWLTPELQEEIRVLIADSPPEVAGYRIRRLSSFCGRFMRHSGWWPDWVVRLTRRGKGRFNDELVHDRMLIDGTVRDAKGVIMHEAFESLDEVLTKMNRYSAEGARMLARRDKKGSIATAVAHGLWAFFRTYVLRTGFLDGREGFLLAVSTAEAAYYKYVKLMLMSSGSRSLGS
jgi:glycosyltransferase involved in cell wall biosynthesis